MIINHFYVVNPNCNTLGGLFLHQFHFQPPGDSNSFTFSLLSTVTPPLVAHQPVSSQFPPSGHFTQLTFKAQV